MFGHITSSPRVSSISLFSLSPGPICLSAKSSCLGRSLSICREEVKAADVRRPRTVEEAAWFWLLHNRSFPNAWLLPLKRLQCAWGFTDLAKMIPQDFAQLCILRSLYELFRKESFPLLSNESPRHWCEFSTILWQLLKPLSLFTAQLHKNWPIDKWDVADALTSPTQTAA